MSVTAVALDGVDLTPTPLVSAAPVRRHVQDLVRDTGVPMTVIARRAGVRARLVGEIVRGEQKSLHRDEAQALLAVSACDLPPAAERKAPAARKLVVAGPAAEHLRSYRDQGAPVSWLSAQTGVSPRVTQALISGEQKRLRVGAHLRILALTEPFTGARGTVPAGPVREHLVALTTSTESVRSVAHKAGVSESTVSRVVNGRYERVSAAVAAALLAVRDDPTAAPRHRGQAAPGTERGVPVEQVADHLDKLVGAGATPPWIASAAGVDVRTVRAVLARRRPSLYAGTAQALLRVPVPRGWVHKPRKRRPVVPAISTDLLLEYVADLRDTHWSMAEIARVAGVHPARLSERAIRAGVGRRVQQGILQAWTTLNGRTGDAVVQSYPWLAEMLSGVSAGDLAAATGLSTWVTYKALKGEAIGRKSAVSLCAHAVLMRQQRINDAAGIW